MSKNPKILPAQDKLNDTQIKSIGTVRSLAPRVRAPNEALPLTFTESKLPSMTIPKMEPVRPGAEDFLKIPQVGVYC